MIVKEKGLIIFSPSPFLWIDLFSRAASMTAEALQAVKSGSLFRCKVDYVIYIVTYMNGCHEDPSDGLHADFGWLALYFGKIVTANFNL